MRSTQVLKTAIGAEGHGMIEPTRREVAIGDAAADHSMEISRAIVDGELETEEVAILRELSKNDLLVLWAKIRGISERGKMTDAKIAAIAGVSVKTVQRAKQKKVFHEALSIAVRNELSGNIDLYIKALNHLALTEYRFNAIKLALETIGFHKPTSRVESVNVNIDASSDTGKLPIEIRIDLVKRWHELGWTIEDFVDAWKSAGF
jgi:hypothetical protein